MIDMLCLIAPNSTNYGINCHYMIAVLLWITYFSVVFTFRWEELHTLASEPTDWHVLFAEDTDDAANGLYTTLTGSTICSAAFPGHPNRFLCVVVLLSRPSLLLLGVPAIRLGLFHIQIFISLWSPHL